MCDDIIHAAVVLTKVSHCLAPVHSSGLSSGRQCDAGGGFGAREEQPGGPYEHHRGHHLPGRDPSQPHRQEAEENAEN